MSLEIVWSPLARRRLREIKEFVARDKPQAAERLTIRLVALAELLAKHPHLGKVERQSKSREFILGGTPYIVVYRVHKSRVVIRTIRHGAQRR